MWKSISCNYRLTLCFVNVFNSLTFPFVNQLERRSVDANIVSCLPWFILDESWNLSKA